MHKHLRSEMTSVFFSQIEGETSARSSIVSDRESILLQDAMQCRVIPIAVFSSYH